VVIPFEPLWEQYNRIIKDNGAIVLFGSEPFSSYLRLSNINIYRYDWIWQKSKAGNFMSVKKQPQKMHENISVFYKKQPTYNPQMEDSTRISSRNKGKKANVNILGLSFDRPEYVDNGKRYPYSIQFYSNQSGELNNINRIHPTQKPVDLLEYLIKTYTNENETVLDNCAGSFTTAVACDNTNRNWICIEKEEEYCNIGLTRINDNRERLSLPLLKLYNSRGDLIGKDD
jgi:site-specific DNA-methyltransferase (adenine-specific)